MRAALVHGRLLSEAEETFFHRDGTPCRVLVTNAPVMVGDRVGSAVLTVADVTARFEAKARLQASEARWRGLFENMREGFFLGGLIRDGDGAARDYRFLEVNPAFAVQTGLPAGIAGQTMREHVPDIPQSLPPAFGFAGSRDMVNLVASTTRLMTGRGCRRGRVPI